MWNKYKKKTFCLFFIPAEVQNTINLREEDDLNIHPHKYDRREKFMNFVLTVVIVKTMIWIKGVVMKVAK